MFITSDSVQDPRAGGARCQGPGHRPVFGDDAADREAAGSVARGGGYGSVESSPNGKLPAAVPDPSPADSRGADGHEARPSDLTEPTTRYPAPGITGVTGQADPHEVNAPVVQVAR